MSEFTSVNYWQSLSDTALAMRQKQIAGLTTLENWQKDRPAFKAQYMQSLGLSPLPSPCELNITEHGSFEGQGYKARKIAYQMLPNCWISGTIYYPDAAEATDKKVTPAPAILYVCGHAPLAIHHYQYHPIMWARRGYVCLIIETIEQSDNQGEHHGSNSGRMNQWLSLGYSPTGAEVYSGMRAIDLLGQDPRVDENRIGVTGVSGGGSISFHLAAADERIKAVSTLCGVSSQVDAVTHHKLLRNCDCFYPHNLFGRDKSIFAGLIAPRPALFCFAEHDPLFDHPETRTFVDKTRKVYELFGQPDQCQWLGCPGQHGDHIPFDQATAKWMDTHVAGESRPAVPRGEREHDEMTTSVFQGLPPSPNHLPLLPELLCPQGYLPLPMSEAQWPEIQQNALAQLHAQAPGFAQVNTLDVNIKSIGQWVPGEGKTSHEYHGQINQLPVSFTANLNHKADRRLIIGVANEGESALHAYARTAESLDMTKASFAGFGGRIANAAPASMPPAIPPGSTLTPPRLTMMRAMAMLGTSPVLMAVLDLLALVKYLRTLSELKDYEFYLHGKDDGAVAALYAALLEPDIKGVALEGLVASHRDGGAIPGVLRAFDIPQAVGLLAPRKVALLQAGHRTWTWPARVYARLGCASNYSQAADRRQAFEMLLG